MIKAKIVSVTINEAIGGVTKLDLETYLEDKVDLNSFYAGMDFDGLDAVIMTKEEYEAMDSASNVLRQSLLEEREKTRQLEEEVEKLNGENQKERIKELEKEIEKSRSESRELMAKNIEIQYDRTITKMTNSRLSENVKEYKETIQKLREENEVIQKDIKELEEKLAQDAAELDIHPDGTIIFRKKRVSELEKKVEELEEENKDLKKKVERLKEELFFFYKGLKYNERVSELEKEVEELNKSKSDMWLERNTLKAENERLQKKIEDLERSKKALDDEYIRRVSENMALEKKLERLQDAAELDIHPDGPIVFRQLEEENKDLKKEDDEVKLKISDEFTLNITSGLLYKED